MRTQSRPSGREFEWLFGPSRRGGIPIAAMRRVSEIIATELVRSEVRRMGHRILGENGAGPWDLPAQ